MVFSSKKEQKLLISAHFLLLMCFIKSYSSKTLDHAKRFERTNLRNLSALNINNFGQKKLSTTKIIDQEKAEIQKNSNEKLMLQKFRDALKESLSLSQADKNTDEKNFLKKIEKQLNRKMDENLEFYKNEVAYAIKDKTIIKKLMSNNFEVADLVEMPEKLKVDVDKKQMFKIKRFFNLFKKT